MTGRAVHVCVRRQLLEAQRLEGATAVMVDVFRASTTIVRALASGARYVQAFGEVEECRRAAARAEGTVLGGERGAERIEGFDLGNSPLEYTPEAVGGRPVFLTTTNGTRTLANCRGAALVLVAGFVNARAAAARAAAAGADVHVACAGTDGGASLEDSVCAGVLGRLLVEEHGFRPDDETLIAMAAARRAEDEGLERALLHSRGSRRLRGLGFEADIHAALGRDRFELVPVLDPVTGRIVPARGPGPV